MPARAGDDTAAREVSDRKGWLRQAAVTASLGLAALLAQSVRVAAGSGAAPLADEGEIPWFLLLSPEVIKALLLVIGILIVVLAVAALIAYRVLRRSGRWDRAVLLLRSRYDEGPRAELADLRLRLLNALEGARRAVELGAAEGNIRGELAGLQRRLQRLAVPLDRQLELLQSEPDERSLGRMLGPARARVREFERVARSLRENAAVELEGEMVGELPELGAAADLEPAGREDAQRRGRATTRRAEGGSRADEWRAGALRGGRPDRPTTLSRARRARRVISDLPIATS